MSTTIWTPDPGEPLLEVQEDERNVSAVVTAYENVESGVVSVTPLTSVSWSTDTPLPAQVRVTASDTTLTLDAPDMLGAFEPVRIRFVRPPGDGRTMEYGEIQRWSDLPDDAVEIVEFTPHPVGLKTFHLTVTTNTGDAAVYRIVVRANFTTGRDRLVREIERRRKTS